MPDTFHSSEHNHAHCVRQALHQAEQVCRDKNARLTPLRRRVLQLIWASHQPITAYQLLRILRREKHNAEPTTVYRALEFLQQYSLVHRLANLNAYIGCTAPKADHVSQFLICTQCRQVAELAAPAVTRSLTQTARSLGFEIAHSSVEIMGRCPACASR